MKDNTSELTKIIDDMMSDNEGYFTELEELKKSGCYLKDKIYSDFNLSVNGAGSNHWKEFDYLIKSHITNYVAQEKIDKIVLEKISRQLELEFLRGKRTKEKAIFYISLSDGIKHYAIYDGRELPSFSYIDFWMTLFKMLHVRIISSQIFFSTRCDENAYKIEGFDELPHLIKAIRLIEEKLSEDIILNDGSVFFTKGQEDRIVAKIEKKLSGLDLYQGLRMVFNIYEENKKNYRIERTIPYKYIVNMMVKNLSKSKNKRDSEKKLRYVIDLMGAFISLYELENEKFSIAGVSNSNLVSHLKKQVLYSNFYPIYPLKTMTLIEFIKGVVEPNINKDVFQSKAGFSLADLVRFFTFVDGCNDNVIALTKENLSGAAGRILDFFAIDGSSVNENYSTMSKLIHNTNIFTMNPIVKYKKNYYLIGFKYFKINFYNALLEKIRKEIDKGITAKIGSSIDTLVEDVFKKVQAKNGFEIYSGRYTPPKKGNPESDLLIKNDSDIILIENKNKYLTRIAFSGDESEILKDFILSFGFSQKQLLNHEKNIRDYKKLKFSGCHDFFEYEGQNIIKISISTNNWYGIMNNSSSYILPAIAGLRFNIESNSDEKYDNSFVKANEYLDEIESLLMYFKSNHSDKIKIILTQTVFLPLELIIDKYRDESFMNIIKMLVTTKMNTDNVMNVYDYCKFLHNYKNQR